jgi:hypothetical protein
MQLRFAAEGAGTFTVPTYKASLVSFGSPYIKHFCRFGVQLTFCIHTARKLLSFSDFRCTHGMQRNYGSISSGVFGCLTA